jgi:hypothetical protein
VKLASLPKVQRPSVHLHQYELALRRRKEKKNVHNVKGHEFFILVGQSEEDFSYVE